jgi:hypothetical protein
VGLSITNGALKMFYYSFEMRAKFEGENAQYGIITAPFEAFQ